jgi:hypothetical protein
MRQVYLISIFVVLTTTLFGQTSEIELYKRADNVATISELTRFRDKVKFSKQSSDTLNLGVVQTNWTINKGSEKYEKASLVTLSIRDNIIYRVFSRQELTGDLYSCTDDCWTFKKIHVKVDSTQFDHLKTIASENNLIVDFTHIEPFRSTFGYYCFNNASMPDEGKQMLKLTKEKDIAQLTNWLYSINPIKQVYAYLGLRLLNERDSIQLTTDIEKKMTDIENSSTSIYTCHGCTIWSHQTIKSQLTKDNVKEFIEHRGKIK